MEVVMRFRAEMQLGGKTATGIPVPEDVVESLGTSKRPTVRVTFNGHNYRSTVARMGGRYMLPVSGENREHAGVAAGDEVDVEIELDTALDTAPRELTLPPDLVEALEGDADAKRFSTLVVQQEAAIHDPDRAGKGSRDTPVAHRQGGCHVARGPNLTAR